VRLGGVDGSVVGYDIGNFGRGGFGADAFLGLRALLVMALSLLAAVWQLVQYLQFRREYGVD
jgi:hypothetical protein